MKARVYVTLKAGVLDVQGKAVEGTLHRMGFEDMSGVRVGRYLELEVEGEQARSRLDDACRKLLANPVIEDYRIEVF